MQLQRGLPHPPRQAVLKRLAALLLLALAALPAYGADYLQAVEFPYYLYPRTLWERELVWLKNIGVQTVEFSIPGQLPPAATRRIRSHRPHQPAPRSGGLRPPAAQTRTARVGAPAAARPRAGQRAARRGAAARLAETTRAGAGHADRVPRRPHRLRGGPRAGHRCRRASLAGHHHLRQRGQRLRAQPRGHDTRRAGRCCGPTWKTPSIPRDGPPTPPRCCARARWDSPATSTPPPPRCGAMPRCCAVGRACSPICVTSRCRSRPPANCPKASAPSNWCRRPPARSASPTPRRNPSTTTCAWSNRSAKGRWSFPA